MTCLRVPTSILSIDRDAISHEAASRITAIADRVGFVLLLLAVSTLLVRPADLLPSLDKAPIYECLIVACIVVSMPRLAELLTFRSLRANSIMALVLLLIPAVMLSHLSHANTYDARVGGFEIAKGCLFFLLTVCHINSFRRLRLVLWVVMAGVFVEALLSVLQYRGILHLAALETVAQKWRDANGDEAGLLNRLCGIGVFHDPNDFSLVLVVASVVCTYAICECKALWKRILLLAPLALFGYALLLTHSRGGFTAAGGALLAFLPARFGWRNTVPLACVLLPVLFVSFSGRQTQLDLNNPNDTFQARLGLWSDSFDRFRAEPVFGVGQGKLRDQIGQVCHNSYLHAFTETGLLGGVAFAGAFYLVLRSLWLASPGEPRLIRLKPFMLAVVASYAVGLLSLSRCYTVPTQLILALGTIFLMLSARRGIAALPRFDGRCARRVVGAGTVVLLGSYVFLRVMIERGHP